MGHPLVRLFVAVAAMLAAGALGLATYLRTSEPEGKLIHSLVVQSDHFVREVQAEGYLQAEQATPITTPPGRRPLKIAWLQKNGQPVRAGDVVVRFDQEQLRRSLADGQDDLAIANAKLATERMQTSASVSDRQRKAEMAQMDLAQAKDRASSQDDEIFSRNELIGSQIDGKLSEARVSHANKASRVDKAISGSKLELLALERQAANIAIDIAQKGLERMEVTAPHDGIFVYEDSDLKIGDSIYPRQTVGKLPLIDKMEAEVFVLEADARGLEVGKKATVVLEAHRDIEFSATIKSVATLAKPRQRDVPIQYFAVILELEKTDTTVMKPGQRVNATLSLDSVDALVVPRQCIFTVDGDFIAYRLSQGHYEPVSVTLGTGTPGRVVIEKGLMAGDIIATQDPFAAAQSSDGEDTDSETSEGAKP